jgi:hypothetical protein
VPRGSHRDVFIQGGEAVTRVVVTESGNRPPLQYVVLGVHGPAEGEEPLGGRSAVGREIELFLGRYGQVAVRLVKA